MLRKAILHLSTALIAVSLTACGDPIEITVQNDGPTPLEDVVVRTQQESYTFGDIPPGDRAVEGIDVLGDSDLAIYHSNHPEWQTVNIYITRGYAGEITLIMEDGELVNFTEDLRP